MYLISVTLLIQVKKKKTQTTCVHKRLDQWYQSILSEFFAKCLWVCLDRSDRDRVSCECCEKVHADKLSFSFPVIPFWAFTTPHSSITLRVTGHCTSALQGRGQRSTSSFSVAQDTVDTLVMTIWSRCGERELMSATCQWGWPKP